MGEAERLTKVTRTNVLGIPVDVVPEDALAEAITEVANKPGHDQVVLIKLWDLMRARRNGEFRKLLHNAGLVVPISNAVVRGARFLLRTSPLRYLPFDFVVRVLSALEERGASVYLLGMERRYLQVVEQNLRQTYPGLRIVGRYQGFYPRYLEESIITSVKKSAPSCLLVGRGIHGGNRWLYKNRSRFSTGISIWVPDVLDMFADRKKRPSRRAYERGLDTVPDVMRRPWRLLRGLVYLWYGVLLIIYRVFRLG